MYRVVKLIRLGTYAKCLVSSNYFNVFQSTIMQKALGYLLFYWNNRGVPLPVPYLDVPLLYFQFDSVPSFRRLLSHDASAAVVLLIIHSRYVINILNTWKSRYIS